MNHSKLYIFICLIISGFFSIEYLKAQNNATNLALDAEVSTSYVSSWETLEAVNDNYIPLNSEDDSHGAYGNWAGSENYDTENWVEYKFSKKNKIDSVRVYWWTDGGGIQIPYMAYVKVWDCNSFVLAGYIGVNRDQFNTLTMNKETYIVRIYMWSKAATGILEFQVFGSEGAETAMIPYIQKNSGEKQQENKLTVDEGDTIILSNELVGMQGGTWKWTGPKGFTSTDSVITLNDIQFIQTGYYNARYTSDCGVIYSQDFIITIKAEGGGAYVWPEYYPTLDYDFREEFPSLPMPTRDLNDCDDLVAGTISSGWWTFKWGHNKRSVVTEAAVIPMLERMNNDFAYFRDTMGWPPDKRAKNGYRSTIYLYGSGLCTDNADSNALGGWQGSYNNYPMVLISYYPVYCFDPDCPYSDREWQMGAVVHEGIHSILADLPGCKEACWFHEGGNTWLQQEADARRSGDYSSMGYLNGCSFLAPFMPIECYSGWLQDNSFGGPCAQGVDMYEGTRQICTWRNYLGGNQYGNAFPTLLGQVLGKGSIPWIWRYCEGKVLEGMADTLGDYQMRRLITEYRAKQALVDLKEWTGAFRKLLDTYTNIQVRAEWQPSWLNPDVWIASPYARATMDDNGVLTPEYRTTPGWSGANQIPLKVKADSVYIDFKPIGKNMKCLICYRDITGNPVYSMPVDSGECSMFLASPPANDVVIAVIVNTDYEYNGEETRKAHFDYRIQIDTSLTVPAHTHKRWYAWDDNPSDDVPPALPPISDPDTVLKVDNFTLYNQVLIYPNPNAGIFTIEMNDDRLKEVVIFDISGKLIFRKNIYRNTEIINLSANPKGIYIMKVITDDDIRCQKIVIN